MPTNILFFLTDQHRYDTMGFNGNRVARTPVLDAIAAEGTVFDSFYTPTAICTPARASLLTGAAPFRHQLLANYERNVGYKEELDPEQFTFSRALRDAGYNVGLVGKWHVGSRRTAADHGFDGDDFRGWHNPVDHPLYEAFLAERGHPPYAISGAMRGRFPNGNEGNLIAARLEQPVEATFEYFLAEQAIERLRQYAAEHHRDGRPFYLATHFFGPHLPYIIPQEYFDLYDPADISLPASIAETFAGKPPVQANYSAHWAFDTMPEDQSRKLIAAYWGYVTMIDEQIGRVLDAARELDVLDDSAIFFSADHGEFTGAHRLHDKGPAMYEDIYHLPCVVRAPAGVSGRCSRYATLIDFTATILDLAGLDPGQVVDGESLLPVVRGEAVPERDELVLEFHGHHFPYPQRALLRDGLKLVVNPESVNELYDLRSDPDELHNRYQHPELRAQRDALMHRLYHLLRERGDNFYHWMATMYDVGPKDYDPTLSAFEPTP
ncbi:MAG: Mucin-desulfating sulfatase MdsA precursor [uncultured Friedmanniella sp.]|uniref:Mucin-desulfating sulfatase MdsA n=1 Tax=uncultured Friedmanniella sp. TaxID=335381 RepID=A0A6J4KDH3_9ACTN|nr:MAG: Mucin-desulfating sulfatase MdsA precursor [uncultured Friedmanniella sp.]